MKLFENKTYTLLPYKDFKLFSDAAPFPSADSALGQQFIEKANEALKSEIPQLYASVYRRFTEDGNRTDFEDAYFGRRTLLRTLLLGEITENKNRYTDKIIDLVWLMLEETSWVLPAHNHQEYSLIAEDTKYTPLPLNYDGTYNFIDLFSAETGTLLSLVYYFLKDKIEAKVPGAVNDRIVYAVNTRILAPFLRLENMWWMGKTGKRPNNWNPWIISNVLLCCACAEANDMQRSRITHKALRILDAFIDPYAEDGGCNEGPHYWSEASGGLMDIFEILEDLTGGCPEIFETPLVYNMFDYIRKVHMTGNYFTTFADAAPELYKDGLPYVLRMAKKTKNAQLYDFAAQLTPTLQFPYASRGHNYRIFKNLCTEIPAQTDYTPADFDCLPNLQIAVWRKGGFCAAIKGGHNGESHNHNDVGNCIILHNAKPIFIDIGAPTYTKDLFSSKRYEVFPTASEYHNLPIVNGHTQKVGADYRANRFAADVDSGVVDYTSAYGDETVRSCVREINVTENSVSLHESIKANGEIQLQYYMAKQPQMLEGNILALEGVNITLPSDVNCSIEAVPLTDAKIIKNWHTDTLYKLVIVGKNDIDITLQIEPEI
ncbi:MAG: heparinase II/III family protein [Clostridia bacterium]|nr:heparinase II/III family protein [Clostridia bacterium]